jgi:alkanesulfonate monooxygenase SsuD/methylene tetrahydromethanopterin reductase-like flavin-dependent oxidoreductase (luciferase family)
VGDFARFGREVEELEYEPFTSHTLMTPYFSPRPSEHGTPPIFVAALGPKITGVAGEVCDGLLLHPMATETFVRDVVSPALDAGLARAGRQRSDIQVARTVFVATGTSDVELQAARAGVRDRIGFDGATPAYKPVLRDAWAGGSATAVEGAAPRGPVDGAVRVGA